MTDLARVNYGTENLAERERGGGRKRPRHYRTRDNGIGRSSLGWGWGMGENEELERLEKRGVSSKTCVDGELDRGRVLEFLIQVISP